MARRPQTKGKVESQMKILDEIHAYQGKLTIQEISQATRQIPSALLEKKKESLPHFQQKVIRDSYRMKKLK